MEQGNALPVDTRLGEYEILEVLGLGSFGITYRAHDPHLNKVVAIKEYLPGEFAMRTARHTVVPNSEADAADYKWGLARFLDEARTLARFDHPHLNDVLSLFILQMVKKDPLVEVEAEPHCMSFMLSGPLPAFVVFVSLLLLLPASVSGQTAEEIEDLFWRSVECASERQVDLYLETYPNGTYVAEARACLEQQRLQEAREIEDLFWRSVECRSRLQVQTYLTEFPEGRYVAEAWACLEGQLGLDRAARVLVQQGLAAVGHDLGPADGLFGGAQARTRQAIGAWQVAKGMSETGYLTREQADALIGQGREAVARAEAARQRVAEERRQAQADAERQRQEEEAQRQAQEAERQRAAEAERQAQADERQRQEAARKRTQPGETFRDCPVCPELVVVPAGTFLMGSPSYEAGRDENEGPVHQVTIGKPLAVGKYEVTVEEYGRFVSTTGYEGESGCRVWTGEQWEEEKGRGWREPGFQQTGRDPVVCVSWPDAQAYAEWLSRETGKTYRLLSESEWKYVARAGTTTARYWGEREGGQCQYANGSDQTAKRHNNGWTGAACDDEHYRTAPAGTYQANGFDLYDILGNVWEWVEDCWNESYAGAPSAGWAWERGDCSRRVLRGGSWGDLPRTLRSARRGRSTAGIRLDIVGFRIARNLD